MPQSRLERVRSKRAGKQGIVYLVLAAILIVGTISWGLPTVARLTGYLIRPDNTPVQLDELRPTPPIFSDIPEATYSAKVKIAGFAQPGLDVVLFVNGAETDRKLVSESGVFSFDKVGLAEGDNTVYAYSATPKDLRSEQSRSYVIVLDTTKPVVSVNTPHDGDVFRGQSQRIASFSGTVSELGSRLYIGERMVIVQSDGTFTLSYQLIEGDQEIPLKVVDKAGNENVTTMKLRWEP